MTKRISSWPTAATVLLIVIALLWLIAPPMQGKVWVLAILIIADAVFWVLAIYPYVKRF